MLNVDLQQTLYAESTRDWRKWLEENCQSAKVIWLIIYNKKSKTPCVHWNDAIENALCYGWVDSMARKRDDESCFLKFTPRNPKSKWSKRNRERAMMMTQNGLMTEHGQKLIDIAKTRKTWDHTNP